MKKIAYFSICIFIIYLLLPFKPVAQINQQSNITLAQKILSDNSLNRVDAMGWKLLIKQFNAGDGYSQVWNRDLNTFTDIALEVRNANDIKGVLKTFLEFQQPNNEIVDCYGLKEKNGATLICIILIVIQSMMGSKLRQKPTRKLHLFRR